MSNDAESKPLNAVPEVWWQKVEQKDVKQLVYATEDIMVWIDHVFEIDWFTSDDYEGPKDQNLHGKVLNSVARLECIPNAHQAPGIRLSYKRMLGEAIVRSLYHDYEGAMEICKTSEFFINQRNLETARFWQLSTAGVVAAVILILSLTFWINRDWLISLWQPFPFLLVMASYSGGLGAVLSMILRMGNTMPTSEAPLKLHIAESCSRILAGALSGTIVAWCVKIGLILSVLIEKGDLRSAMIIAAFIGGMSERYIPSLVELLDKPTQKLIPKTTKTK